MVKRGADAIDTNEEDKRSKRPARSSSPNKSTRTSQRSKASSASTTTTDVKTTKPPSKGKSNTSKPAPDSPPPDPSDSSSSDVDPILIRYQGLPKLVKNPILYVSPLDFLTPCPWVLPTKNNAITKFDPNVVARDALETNVILHPRLPALITAFLKLKIKYGSDIEQRLYNSMSQHDLVARLVEKRCLHFVNSFDYTVLRNCTKAGKGTFNPVEWLRVGQPNEHLNKYIKLDEYLSYDEMMLGSLLGSSGPTFFINTGDRQNVSRKDPKGTFQDRGIIVGLVGPRLHKPGQMDAALMQRPIGQGLAQSSERQQDPRVTRLFLSFFGSDKLPGPSSTFGVDVYKARIRLTIETLLLESDDRAAQAGQTAYVHLIGLGLGVWAWDPARQGCWYVEVATQILREMHLKHISTLEIAWVSAAQKQREECIAAGKEVGILVKFNKRPPCEKLETEELLVRCWAWDSNTLAGNEYWSGILDDSDDPTAVCNSTAAELHNPYVNPFAHRIKVLQDRRRV